MSSAVIEQHIFSLIFYMTTELLVDQHSFTQIIPPFEDFKNQTVSDEYSLILTAKITL